MKNWKIAAVAFFFAFMALPNLSFGQCDVNEFMDKCNSKLSDGYTFLKSYSIDKQKASNGNVEYSYVFSKNTNYMLTLCAQGGDPKNMVVSLYNSKRKLLLTSYNKSAGKFLDKIAYRCGATGIYYLQFSFKGKPSSCGGSVLAFKR